MPLDPNLVKSVSGWVFDEALPFWADRGLDRIHGGGVEGLTLDGLSPSGVPYKRVRVACRQLYVFSHAELLGWAGARAAADHIYEGLISKFWRGPEHGWVRRTTAEGQPLDLTPDLYDYAFALFGLSWRFKATRDESALQLAHATLDFIEKRFAHPEGGFHHELPPSLPRQQNPHMHLIEALLVAAEASQQQRFADHADDILTLFKNKLVRRPLGILPEFFDESWAAYSGESGRWVEPGHQFEWAWILAQHQKLFASDNAAAIAALVAWAEQHGVDPVTQATFNNLRDDGTPLDRGSRTWPNTERLKGWLGLYETTGADPRSQAAGSARLLLDRYLGAAPKGCWIDSFDEYGKPTAEAIPASTLYHVFLAFAELLRLSPKLI
jgi:N-acylglucosamine 2-epimerase/mannose-6-phosphate isomerase